MADKETHKAENFINGVWTDALSGKGFKSLNPADTDDVVGIAPASAKADVDRAVEAAQRAFRTWRLVPPPKRGEILFRAAELIAKNKETLGRLVTREMGKVLREGMGDVQEAVDMAYYMAGEGRRLSGETVYSELPDKDCKSVRAPVGVFALITPWNFPVAIPAWKLFPALICGNTVVFKPSSLAPVVASKLVELIVEAGVPDGVLNLVHGSGVEAGEYLATHPGIDSVSFTGSAAVGERLFRACGQSGKGISCEMGGKNPIIVMDDANLGLAVDGALWAAFGTTGQRCTAAGRLIVHKDIYDRFTAMLLNAASRLKVGNGLKPEVQMGPLVNRAQMDKALGYVEIGKKEGAKLLSGGRALNKGARAKGFFMEPAVFGDVLPMMRIAQEEIFGPVAAVIRAGSLEEAVGMANDVEYGLSASIYTQDVNNSAIAERDLDAGIVYINAPTIGAEIQLPFGGVKKSGFGHREAGGRGGAIEMFTKWKVIYRDFSGRLQKAQIDR